MFRGPSRYIFNRGVGTFRHTLVALIGVGTIVMGFSLAGASENRGDMCSVAKRALEEAARIRGLSVEASVPCVVRTRGEIEGFLRQTIAEKFPKDTLAMEQLVYRAIGLVPDDYDYVQGIVTAYVQQIGGYYDPDKRLFVMLDTMPEALQLPVAVHELTHALQDQKFKLTTFLEPTKMSNDELMARAALVEGDATAVMQDFMSSQRHSKERVSHAPSAREVSVPVPAALERVLLFPYIQGLSFTRRIIREGGFAAINDAFARPPATSREILHPEQYITRAFIPKSLEIKDEEKPMGVGPQIFTDTVGEFVISSLIGAALSSQTRGEGCAQGWRRDRIAAFNGEGGKRFISWMSEWDSDTEAQEFSDCYRETLKVRYQKDVQGELLAVSQSKKMRVQQEGALVSIMVEVAR
jgi:hypothetical protein